MVTERGLADLYQLLEDDVNLPEETVWEKMGLFLEFQCFFQVQKIACQLVSALYYLHSHRVLHRGEFDDIRDRLRLFSLNRYETAEYLNLSRRQGEVMWLRVCSVSFVYGRLEVFVCLDLLEIWPWIPWCWHRLKFELTFSWHFFWSGDFQGTPLYMCPELVDEKPYDHSAALW